FCFLTLRAHVDCVFFFFQAEDGIRDFHVTGFRRVLFRSRRDVLRELRVTLERRQVARAAAFVRYGERLADAEREVRVVIEEKRRSEERRVGKECGDRGSPYRRQTERQRRWQQRCIGNEAC